MCEIALIAILLLALAIWIGSMFVPASDSPWWPPQMTKAEYMAKKYGLNEDANDPNFLHDYYWFTGHEYPDINDSNLW